MKKIATMAFACSLFVLLASAAVAGPEISVSPASVDFGQVPVYSIASAFLVVTNTGDEVLQISQIRTWTPFLDSQASGVFLQPNQSLKMQVGFAPTVPGSYNSYCSFMSNATNAPVFNVPLAGDGVN